MSLLKPLIRFWEYSDSVPGKVDLIIGVGTGLMPDGICAPQSGAIAERTSELFAKGISSQILFTGGNPESGICEAEAMAKVAIARGVPSPRIIIEPTASDTRENALKCATILRGGSVRRIVCVASRLHARRVRGCFRKVLPGVEVLVVGVRSYYNNTVTQKRLHSETRFFLWNIGAHLVYKIRGWL